MPHEQVEMRRHQAVDETFPMELGHKSAKTRKE